MKRLFVSMSLKQNFFEGPEGGVRIPVPSIEMIQNLSPNMKKGKIPSLEAVVPTAQHAMTKDLC